MNRVEYEAAVVYDKAGKRWMLPVLDFNPWIATAREICAVCFSDKLPSGVCPRCQLTELLKHHD